MLFVVVLWLLGFGLATRFLRSGIAKLVRERPTMRRKSHLGIPDAAFRSVAVVEVAAAIGLLLAAFNGSGDRWPALFHSSAFTWFGFVSAIALLAVMIGSVISHRRAHDDANDYIPAMALAFLCVAYVIALGARQLVVGR